MANPNISLLGAVYPTVSGVTLPKQGGGTATFPWVEGSQTITTNNTYDVTNLASVVVNVSGGGGASNIVTGTFKGTTTGAAMDVTLNYTGSGYPIAVMVYPSAGNASGSAYGDLIQKYAIGYFYVVRNDPTDSTSATAMVESIYKNNSTSSTNYVRNGSYSGARFQDSNATSGYGTALAVRSATKMSVFIASNSYGFAANIDYTYHVIYSS